MNSILPPVVVICMLKRPAALNLEFHLFLPGSCLLYLSTGEACGFTKEIH